MSNRIDINELKKALERVGSAFSTKDVSEQPELRSAHRTEAAHSHWHAFVGAALSQNRGLLGLESAGRGTRGERWTKTAGGDVISRPTAPRRASAGTDFGVGPQAADDPSFTARMRLHQSWWRANVLKVPCGVGPQASSTSRYGNMLEQADAAAGKNFLTPQIHEVAMRRMAEKRGAIDDYRLLHNLLSSQPMCFNLFGPLVGHPERATRLLRSLLGNDEVANVTRVAIEWAPEPAAAYLADRTAFDAVIDYERPDGKLVLLGIETKLTDSFSQKPYDGDRYRNWMRGARSPFRTEAAGQLSPPRFNQLWRNHLLAIAVRDQASSRYADVRSAVVHHSADASAQSIVADYRNLLVPADQSFSSWTLEAVVDAFSSAASSDETEWLNAFRRRYIDLSESADLRC